MWKIYFLRTNFLFYFLGMLLFPSLSFCIDGFDDTLINQGSRDYLLELERITLSYDEYVSKIFSLEGNFSMETKMYYYTEDSVPMNNKFSFPIPLPITRVSKEEGNFSWDAINNKLYWNYRVLDDNFYESDTDKILSSVDYKLQQVGVRDDKRFCIYSPDLNYGEPKEDFQLYDVIRDATGPIVEVFSNEKGINQFSLSSVLDPAYFLEGGSRRGNLVSALNYYIDSYKRKLETGNSENVLYPHVEYMSEKNEKSTLLIVYSKTSGNQDNSDYKFKTILTFDENKGFALIKRTTQVDGKILSEYTNDYQPINDVWVLSFVNVKLYNENSSIKFDCTIHFTGLIVNSDLNQDKFDVCNFSIDPSVRVYDHVLSAVYPLKEWSTFNK